MAISDVLQDTALTSEEVRLIEDAQKLFKEFPVLQSGVLIGGLACRILASSKYKANAPVATDIDLYFHAIPSEVMPHVKETRLVEKIRQMGGMQEREVAVFETDPSLKVYKFEERPETEHVDLFEETVGRLHLPHTMSTIRYSLEDGVALNVAEHGVVIATQLKPESFRQKRDARTRCLIATIEDDTAQYDHAIDVCATIFNANGITKEAFDGVKNSILNKESRKTPAYANFVSQVYDRLKP